MNAIMSCWKMMLCLGLVYMVLGQNVSLDKSLTIKLVRIGDDVSLTCEIDSNFADKDKLSIEWQNAKKKSLALGPKLVLKNVQQADMGQYICIASGPIEGRIVSVSKTEEVTIEKSKVFVQSAPDIMIPQSVNGHISLYETQNLKVDCKVGNWSREEYEVQWIKTDGYVTSNNEVLYIESVLKEKDEGVYTCTIQRKDNQEYVFRKSVTITIKVPNMSISILPTENLSVGGMIHRKCEGFQLDQSTETFSYTWMNPSGVRVSRSNTIQISITSVSQSGRYICQYKAARSQKVYVKETDVEITNNMSTEGTTSSISIITTPRKFRMLERMYFRCAVTPTNSGVTYSWYKDEKFIHTGDLLDIETFTKKDLGTYKCHAVGTSNNGRPIDLIAKNDQKIIVSENHRVEMIGGIGTQVQVNMRETKELHCEIDLDTDYVGKDVKWTFNGRSLNTEDHMSKFRIARVDRHIASILVIRNLNVDNDGRYQCSVGDVQKATTITVREESGVLSIYPQIQKSFVGHSSEFHCKINNIPNAKKTDIEWRFVSKDQSRNISLPDNRWKIELSETLQRTSYIVVHSLQMSDNGYMICSLPTGEKDTGEIIVSERIKPFVVKVTKPLITVQKRQRFEFECYSEDKVGNATGTPILRLPNGSLVSDDPRFEVTKVGPSRYRVVAPNGIDVDGGKLRMTCGVEKKVAIVDIKVLDQCPPSSRYCNNGDCLSPSLFCDGKIDCPDGSDEDPAHCEICDPIRKPCGDISSGKEFPLFDIHRRCNGLNECDNGFDEMNCPKPETCNTLIFTCKNKDEIPYGQVCDGEKDCDKAEDEIGCRPPLIMATSSLEVRAKKGDTVRMMCEASGHPKPKIIWRYNWNCMPTNSRTTITEESINCIDVVSVLTIKNFQPGDDGLYNCEALAGTLRYLSKEPIKVSFSKE